MRTELHEWNALFERLYDLTWAMAIAAEHDEPTHRLRAQRHDIRAEIDRLHWQREAPGPPA